MSPLPETAQALAGLDGQGVSLGSRWFLLSLIKSHMNKATSCSWSNPVDLHKFLQTHAGVYALLAFVFLQSGLRLGTFIGWILAKQEARNKNNSFSGLG